MCVDKEPILSSSAFALSVISVTLTFFLLQQMYCVSIGLTQIEVSKLRALRRKDKKYRNLYNNGIIQNWKDFIFPPKIVEHEPYQLKADGDQIILDGIIFFDDAYDLQPTQQE